MPGFGGYYKGEKKKPKKDQNKVVSSNSPTYVMPEIITKKKKEF
jgi:hypothetical protein